MGNLKKRNIIDNGINNKFGLKELLIEITDKCPLNCLHCSSNGNIENNTFISKEIIFDILYQGKKLNATEFQISGGEPFLHKDLMYISSQAVEMGYNISIYTSGNNYVKNDITEISRNLFEKIEQKSKYKIIFGIHGTNKEIHEYVTKKKGSFVNLINSIMNSLDVDIKTEFHFVPNKKNVNQIEQLLKFAEDIGISQVSILRFVKHGQGNLNYKLFEFNENISTYDLFSELKRSYGNFLRLGSPHNPFGIDTLKKCSAGYDKITITPNLKLYPCVAFKQFLNPLNYYDYTLEKAFNSSLFKKIRNFSNNKLNSCYSCDNLTICRGGCVAQRIIQNKNKVSDKDNLCIKNSENNCLLNVIQLYGECNAK